MERYREVEMTFRGVSRPVLVSEDDGPPVVLMHEVFGLTEAVMAFAGMIQQAGFRIYLPVLFGSARPKSGSFAKVRGGLAFACVAHQFKVFAAHESGPWADWLRDLVDRACDETQARGAGVIGLCLTGNFALSAATNPRVLAPVLGEPSLPTGGKGLHMTPKEVSSVQARMREDGLEARAYRYSTDTICSAGMIRRLEQAFGPHLRADTIPVTEKLHSVFTEHLRDDHGALRHDKVAEVIEFLNAKLR